MGGWDKFMLSWVMGQKTGAVCLVCGRGMWLPREVMLYAVVQVGLRGHVHGEVAWQTQPESRSGEGSYAFGGNYMTAKTKSSRDFFSFVPEAVMQVCRMLTQGQVIQASRQRQ